MDTLNVPKVAKTPFLIGDLMLASFAGAVMYLYPHPLDVWPILICGLALMAGVWLGAFPWILQYRGSLKMAEAAGLNSAVERIAQLEHISQQIAGASSQWQTVHQLAGETTQAARQIVDRIGQEARAFAECMQKTHEAEKQHLRLEVEKSRRQEGEWLKITTTILDHVYALHQAGVRSGQTGLIEQLSHFQNACRESARRVGLSVFLPQVRDPFDAKIHQPFQSDTPLPPRSRIERVVAVGYTYQGQVLRRAVVEIQADGERDEELLRAQVSQELKTDAAEPDQAISSASTTTCFSGAASSSQEPDPSQSDQNQP